MIPTVAYPSTIFDVYPVGSLPHYSHVRLFIAELPQGLSQLAVAQHIPGLAAE